MTRFVKVLASLAILTLSGCFGFSSKDTTKAEEAKPERKGVIGKKTQEIGKFDPNANQEVSDQKIHATDPITGPLMAYGPMMEKVSILAIDHATALFYATEGRYPKDYEEFMEKIVKANNIQLPVLPFGGKYQYNEQDHVLVVVRPAATPPDQKNADQKKE